jgi:CRP-like cAMP-binding protein
MALLHEDPDSNVLLASMPRTTRAAIEPGLELVPLKLADVVIAENAVQNYVYFPTGGIVSLVSVLHDGSTSELGIAGNDGLVGLQGAMRAKQAPHRAVVQVAGHALRIRTKFLAERFKTDVGLQDVLQRYSQFVLLQVCQSAVCNRQHALHEQFCRWILLSLDRLETNEVRMTQQLIAVMLGVRREGVSSVATQLKAEGLIDYSRGHIIVRDRAGVEARACECYRAISLESARLFPAAARKGIA